MTSAQPVVVEAEVDPNAPLSFVDDTPFDWAEIRPEEAPATRARPDGPDGKLSAKFAAAKADPEFTVLLAMAPSWRGSGFAFIGRWQRFRRLRHEGSSVVVIANMSPVEPQPARPPEGGRLRSQPAGRSTDGDALRAKRIEWKLTQVEFGRLLGCGGSAVSRLENGAWPIGRQMLDRIAKIRRDA